MGHVAKKADPFAAAYNSGPQLYWTGVTRGTPPPPGMAGVVAAAAVETKERGKGPHYTPFHLPSSTSQKRTPGAPSELHSTLSLNHRTYAMVRPQPSIGQPPVGLPSQPTWHAPRGAPGPCPSPAPNHPSRQGSMLVYEATTAPQAGSNSDRRGPPEEPWATEGSTRERLLAASASAGSRGGHSVPSEAGWQQGPLSLGTGRRGDLSLPSGNGGRRAPCTLGSGSEAGRGPPSLFPSENGGEGAATSLGSHGEGRRGGGLGVGPTGGGRGPPAGLPSFASDKAARLHAAAVQQMAEDEAAARREAQQGSRPQRKADPFADPLNAGPQIFWTGVQKGVPPPPGMAGVIAAAAVETSGGRGASSGGLGIRLPQVPSLSRPQTAPVASHGVSRVVGASRYQQPKSKSLFQW